jgi:hypothetical protein
MSGGKPTLSSRVLGLKFMQRAREKEVKAAAVEAAEEHDAEVRGGRGAVQRASGRAIVAACCCCVPPPGSTHPPTFSLSSLHTTHQAHWVVEGARTRCVVIAEGDPPAWEPAPGGGAGGRLSFGGCNPSAEQLAADAEVAAAAAAAEAANPDGKAVTDEAMAAALRKQKGGGKATAAPAAEQQQQRQQQQRKDRRDSGGKQGRHDSGSKRARHDDGGGSSGKKQRRGPTNGEGDDWGSGGKKPRARYF